MNMRKLPKPSYNISDVITDCVSNMRGGQDKYLAAIPTIEAYSAQYNEAMLECSAHEFPAREMITDDLSKDDMVSLYTNKFSKKDQPGRKYYDRIKLAPTNGICPLCGIGQVATLDHYMAKTLYPALAVTPSNLIPACRDCNDPRGAVRFKSANDLTIHPYYDEVQNIEWLSAVVVSTFPICVQYTISDTLTDPILRDRLSAHLKVFDLSSRYSKKAAEEISAQKFAFQTILDSDGLEGLRGHMRILYTSAYHAEINSWRTALYKALLNVEQIVIEGKIAH